MEAYISVIILIMTLMVNLVFICSAVSQKMMKNESLLRALLSKDRKLISIKKEQEKQDKQIKTLKAREKALLRKRKSIYGEGETSDQVSTE